MRRKVIQIGESTQLVSLPRKWSTKHGVRKGDEVEVNEEGNALTIRTAGSSHQEKKLEITIETPEKFLRRMLCAPYVLGYTEVKVNYSDKRVFEKVSDQVNYLMGWEIIIQGANSCVIRSVATGLDNDLDNIIRRIFLSTAMMMKDMLNAMRQKDFIQLDNLKALELTNNKLTYFSLRLLNKLGYPDSSKTSSVYYTVLLLEEISDDLRDICGHVAEGKLQAGKETLSLMEDVIAHFDGLHTLFYTYNTEKLFQLSRAIKLTLKGFCSALENPGKDGAILSHLHAILKRISHISQEIHY